MTFAQEPLPVTISTDVPVLVPAEKGSPRDGIRNYKRIMEGNTWRTDSQPIRELTREEVERTDKILSEEAAMFLRGVLNLRQGYEADDVMLRTRGFARIENRKEDAEHPLAAFLAYQPAWARVRFSWMVSERLERVRLVMWHSPKRNLFLPAFDCPDLETGILVGALIGIRCCPHCSTLFYPDRNDRLFCRASHRDAYRMNRKRWRDKAAAQQKTAKKGARKYGKR